MRYIANYLRRFIRKETARFVSQSSAMCARRIAVCQMTSVADKNANLSVVSQLISDAVKENVQMIFFPEACDYLCDNKKDVVQFAEPILGGNTVAKYRELAAHHNVWLSMGGVHERDEKDPSKIFNTHLIIDNKGSIVQSYRKLHLFDVEIPEKKVRLKESDISHAGGHVVSPVDSPVGKIGMAICYDMRFPELSTSLSILSAEILTYPSAFTQATGAAHWHVLLRARAIENQCYVIAAAQYGEHNSKRRSYGHALCVDPWGEVLADCGNDSPCYKVVDISLEKLKEVRKSMPVFQHRRNDIYSLHPLSLRNSLLDEHNSTLSERRSSDSARGSCLCDKDEHSYTFGHVKIPESCVFYKSDLSYAFVNLRCVIPGHVLVAPIRPVARNEQLSDKEAADLFSTIRLVQKLMERVHKAEACTITIQDGPEAGQTVKHVHCHVMPRKKGDFIDNDLIYLELAKHDHFKPGEPTKPPRSKDDMCEEAAYLRTEIKKIIEENS